MNLLVFISTCYFNSWSINCNLQKFYNSLSVQIFDCACEMPFIIICDYNVRSKYLQGIYKMQEGTMRKCALWRKPTKSSYKYKTEKIAVARICNKNR